MGHLFYVLFFIHIYLFWEMYESSYQHRKPFPYSMHGWGGLGRLPVRPSHCLYNTRWEKQWLTQWLNNNIYGTAYNKVTHIIIILRSKGVASKTTVKRIREAKKGKMRYEALCWGTKQIRAGWKGHLAVRKD